MNQEIRNKTKKLNLLQLGWPVIAFLLNMYAIPVLLVTIGITGLPMLYLKSTLDIAIIVGTIVYYYKNGIELFPKVKFRWWFLLLPFAVFILNMLKTPFLILIFGEQQVVNGEALIMMMDFNIVYTLIASVLIAPIAEEIIFRGVIMNTIFAKTQWIGLLVSSVLFSLIHTPTNLYSFFNYFTISLLFGGVMMITKSLKWATAAHLVNNLISQILVVILMFSSTM